MLTPDMNLQEARAQQRFGLWAEKTWAGFGGRPDRTRPSAEDVRRQLQAGKVHEKDRAAVAWLLEGTNRDDWEAICAKGRILPSRLGATCEQILDARRASAAAEWAKEWTTGGKEVIPPETDGACTRTDVETLTAGRRAQDPWSTTRRRGLTESEVRIGGQRLVADTDALDEWEAQNLSEAIEIPTKLIQSAREGRLLILLGAGASRQAPANVRLYHELARDVAGVEGSVEELGAALDEARTRIPDLNEKMAQAVEEDEDKNGGRTSPIHEEAVRLAKACGARAILTTNWDRLTRRAWKREQVLEEQTEIHSKWGTDGALNAKGVVLLHGSIEQPQGMLVTASDLKGWYENHDARSFLEEMFKRHSVLTVGYRWNDQVVNEIVTATNEAHGKALNVQWYRIHEALDPEETWHWAEVEERTGMHSIIYPRGKHSVVAALLRRIREAVEERPHTTAKRAIVEIARQGASAASDEDWEQIEKAGREGGAKLEQFLEHATAEAWIGEKLVNAGMEEALSGRGKNKEKWARWLAQGVSLERMRQVIRWTAKCGNRSLDSSTAMDLLWAWRNKHEGPLHEQGAITVWLAAQALQGYERQDVLQAATAPVVALAKAGECQAGLEMLRLGTTLRWGCRETIGPDYEETLQESGEITPQGNERAWALEELWNRLRETLLEMHAEGVLTMFERVLESHQSMVDLIKGQKGSRSSWSWTRSAIEPDDQNDASKKTADICIDGVRDALEALGADEEARGRWEGTITRYADSPSPLLRRCAIHSVRVSGHWSADAKVRWAAGNGRLEDRWCHHERYMLLRECWNISGPRTREWLVDQIERMTQTGENTDEKAVDRYRYDLLGGLARDVKQAQVLERAVSKIEARYPEWGVRPWAAYDRWHSGVRQIGPETPWTREDLLSEHEEGVKRVLEWRPTSAWKAQGERAGAHSSVAVAVEEDPEWGAKLITRLREEEHYTHWAWPALFEALGKLEEKSWKMLESKVPWNMIAGDGGRNEWDIGHMLVACASRKTEREEVRQEIGTALKIARAVWPEMLSRKETGEVSDWTHEAINRGDGKVAESLYEWGRRCAGSGHDAERSTCMATLADLARNSGTHGRACIANLGTVNGPWLAVVEPEWLKKNVLVKLEEDGPEHDAVVQGLAYTTFDQAEWIALLKPYLWQHLMERETSTEHEDSVADKWAHGMLCTVVNGKVEYEDWRVADFPQARRARIVAEVSRQVRHERDLARKLWESLIKKMWRDIESRHAGLSAPEKEAMLHCFAVLTPRQQNEFATMFGATGPAVGPIGHLLGFDNEAHEVNRGAVVRLAAHLKQDGNLAHRWKWAGLLDTLAAWTEDGEGLTKAERALALETLAKHGR